ncbi:EAL domain-containing protein [Oxalobacteraceae bacterium OM1]|nr:EAL domain-containing protein [Oxalobacteraceae bacterium OM1]
MQTNGVPASVRAGPTAVLQSFSSIYGRERELGELTAALNRTIASSYPRLAVLTGEAGIGKTAVAEEFVRRNAEFCEVARGRFDLLSRNCPYAGIAQALEQWLRQLISQGKARLHTLRPRLIEALGRNGNLVVSVVPALEELIGPQPPVPELPPAQAQHRFRHVWRRFFEAIAEKDRPLVLFLDDLQWADKSSLILLGELLQNIAGLYLLIVGTYRSPSMEGGTRAQPPLPHGLAAITHDIPLSPLPPRAVAALLVDAFDDTTMPVLELGEALHALTAGNPLCQRQLLHEFCRNETISFDPTMQSWRWDRSAIQRREPVHDPFQYFSQLVAKLPGSAQDTLQWAALLGNTVNLHALTALCERPAPSTEAELYLAERLGLICKRDNAAYRFVHESMQEMLYAAASVAERADRHLRVARHQAAAGHPDVRATFSLAEHFHQAGERLASDEERHYVAQVQLTAGRCAKALGAYPEAQRYLHQAIALSSSAPGAIGSDRLFDAYLDLAECQFVGGNAEGAEASFRAARAHSRDASDMIKLDALRINLNQVAGKFDTALAIALDRLRTLGITFPRTADVSMRQVQRDLRRLLARLTTAELNVVWRTPATPPASQCTAVDLLCETFFPAFFIDPTLFCQVVCKAVRLTLDVGVCQATARALSSFAYLAATMLNKWEHARTLSEHAILLGEHLQERRWRGSVLVMDAIHLAPRTVPAAVGDLRLEQGFELCLEAGDFVWAGIAALVHPWHAIARGHTLDEASAAADRYLRFAQEANNRPVWNTLRLQQHFILCLQARTASPVAFDTELFSEADCVAALYAAPFSEGLAQYYVMKQVVCYMDGQYAQAHHYAQMMASLPEKIGDEILRGDHLFFSGLTCVALGRASPPDEYRTWLPAATKHADSLRRCAQDCPDNFAHLYLLLRAELASLRGRWGAAQALYERAIASARNTANVHLEGVGNDLAAHFYQSRQLHQVAGVYAAAAYRCYSEWGATRHAERVRSQWPQAAAHPAGPAQLVGVDLETVLVVQQGISGEIVLDRFVEALLDRVAQYAGAQHGYLAIVEDGQWRTVAEVRANGPVLAVSSRLTEHDPGRLMPPQVIDYVRRTRQHVLLGADPAAHHAMPAAAGRPQPLSLLCLPILRQGELSGILYLENAATSHAFTHTHVATLQVLCTQAGISLENARLYTALARENAKRRQAQDRLEYVSNFDALTSLPNRSLFMDRVKQAISYAKRENAQSAVLVIDLHNFRAINDSFGHAIGDRLLVQVSTRLQQVGSEFDTVARLGSSEFAMCLPLLHAADAPGEVAQRVIATLSQPFQMDAHVLHLDASVGISVFPADGGRVENLLRAADTALHFAKNQGGGNYHFFESRLDHLVQNRLRQEARLRQAAAAGELRLYFQPQVDLSSGTIYSAEALLRWEQPGRAPISCGPQLEAIGESRLLLEIGEWSLHQACIALTAWRAAGFDAMRVAVNLSPLQFRQPGFRSLVGRILDDHGVPAHCLNLEITEATLMEHSAENLEALSSLHDMGIKLSIDDFGTGYSSLAYLRQFPVDELKIDQSFIRGMTHSDKDRSLVSAIVAMGTSLQLDVLAEGVETAEQEQYLKTQGCRTAQGFLYSQAVPSHRFLDLLCTGLAPSNSTMPQGRGS